MNAPKHFNSEMANQMADWFGTDSYELYQKNLRERFDELNHNSWIDQKIIYKFNDFGFRADQFDIGQPSMISLGCSHTFGIGCNYESTWSYLVSSALRLKNFNLGIGGSSNDTAFRLASYWIPKLKPKIVVFLSTEPTRLELHLADGSIDDLSVWSSLAMEDQFYKHWVSNHMNSKFNLLKNNLAIKQICEDLGIKFFHEKYDNFKYFYIDLARDLQHFGAKTNQKFANKVLASL